MLLIFGDPDSTSDIVTITEDAGTASYDYPNNLSEVTYTITVTAKSDWRNCIVILVPILIFRPEISGSEPVR